MTIIEVLVAMAVLVIGLLGVAALIPIGKVAMIETDKSDRTGACGRAALREIKVRRMLDSSQWSNNNPSNVFILDPLGYIRIGSSTPLGGPGGVPRISLNNMVAATDQLLAESVFLWHDDLTYVQAKDSTNPTNGDRPIPMMIGAMQQIDGNFSWFFTVAASPAEVQAGIPWYQATPLLQRRQFSVSVVVCWKRLFTAATNDSNAGETVVPSVTCDADDGYGGIGIQYTGSAVMPKENQWVLLTCTAPSGYSQTTWYRVVSAGSDGAATPTTHATLVGPDWHVPGSGGANIASLIVVKGATGVYTTTVQLDNDGIWTK